ncbi:MAG: 3-keto-disaccharide hydrolase [Planctomycetota bacterium]|jgi:hypothetical protein
MNIVTKKLVNLVCVALFLAIVSCTSANAKVNGGDWMRPFDGMTLEGWEVRGGFAKYHVENREIVGTSVEGSPNTFLCTKKLYGDFALEFEVKCDPRLNSGVQVRSHVYKKDTTLEMWRRGQKRKVVRKAGHVYGYQVEISSERTGSSGGIYDEARKGMWLYDVKGDAKASKAFKNNQWNKYRVECMGKWCAVR